MRICLVYDCLFPHTVGGLERYLRTVAERLAAEGHEITYLTLRQWDRDGVPDAPAGTRVVAVGPRMRLYSRGGERRVGPPLMFGAGVLLHLLRHGRRYDVVHTASFPYFSLLSAALVRPLHRFTLVVDWFELWSRAYWREYLGPLGGGIGWGVQALCLRVPQHAFCFARLTERRLQAEGIRGGVTLLTGLWPGPLEPDGPLAAEPLVVFAGRHIPEKRAPAVVGAVARASRAIPGLRGRVLGDGPERSAVLAAISAEDAEGFVEAPGFVGADAVQADLSRALCLLLPSKREGYGLVVVEACSHGTPCVLVADEDNAAAELIEDGVNGVIAASASSEDLAAAIERVHAAGPTMRVSTAAWFGASSARLSLAGTLDTVAETYRDASARS
ncbi:MAG: glycosyltransferase [Solirubrobacterales bacterium]|nr:glycosyltransferase [Solirubrobacterales bacterium]